jgi:YbbR domain-containing protein
MPLKHALIRNWPLKLTSLALSLVLWIVAASEEPSSWTAEVKVAITAPPGRSASWTPGKVRVFFVGPRRELLKLAASPARLTRAVPDSASGRHLMLDLSPSDLELPQGVSLRVQDIEPRLIQVELDSVVRKLVAVHPDIRVESDRGYALAGGIQVVPGEVRLSGPPDLIRTVDSVTTVPLGLTNLEGPVERRLMIDTAPLAGMRVEPGEVTVNLNVQLMAARDFARVPIDVPAALGALMVLDRESVMVAVRGPARRIRGLTPESIHVFVDPARSGRAGRVPLQVVLPPGFTGVIHPDTIVLSRRPGGHG